MFDLFQLLSNLFHFVTQPEFVSFDLSDGQLMVVLHVQQCLFVDLLQLSGGLLVGLFQILGTSDLLLVEMGQLLVLRVQTFDLTLQLETTPFHLFCAPNETRGLAQILTVEALFRLEGVEILGENLLGRRSTLLIERRDVDEQHPIGELRQDVRVFLVLVQLLEKDLPFFGLLSIDLFEVRQRIVRDDQTGVLEGLDGQDSFVDIEEEIEIRAVQRPVANEVEQNVDARGEGNEEIDQRDVRRLTLGPRVAKARRVDHVRMAETLTCRTGDPIAHSTRQTGEQIERAGFTRVGSTEQGDEFLAWTKSTAEDVQRTPDQ